MYYYAVVLNIICIFVLLVISMGLKRVRLFRRRG